MPLSTTVQTSDSAPARDRRPVVLVLTDAPGLARQLLSIVAAVGLAALQEGEVELRQAWRTADAVLIGVDRASAVQELSLPARSELYVVGQDDDRAETSRWSPRLRAAVATVPGGASDLAAALSGLVAGGGVGGVVGVVGGSGGVGASTLAVGLALVAARQGRRTFLADLDGLGGGIDVLLGAEGLAGWRWSRFAAARGHLPDLSGQLPHCDGVDVLAVDREADLAPRADQVAAVLDSTSRSHDLTVVDLARQPGPARDEVLRRAGTVLMVVRSDVRGVAAADATARSLVPRCRELDLVVRTGQGHTLAPALVADTLDLPLAGELPDDPALAYAAERGEPPGGHGRSGFVRLCEQLLRERGSAAA